MALLDYRLEMMTLNYLNISQSIFSPGDQWMASIMQWAMTEDAPASSQVAEREGSGHEGVGDQGAGDQGVGGGEGGRRGRQRQNMFRYL